MGYQSKVRGILSVVVLFAALPACSGDDDGGASAGGSAGMTASGGTDGASRGGAGSSGGAKSQGGALGNPSGGTGGAVDLSSDPGSGKCTDFTPCGGDVLGTWRIESACLDSFNPAFPSCPDASVSLTITGSLTFQSDGSYLPRGTSTSRITLPASCSTLCAAPGCTASAGGGCVCEASEAVNETPLTYSSQGNKLIVTPKSGVTQTAYYCRTGDRILMRGYSSANTRYEYDLRR